MSSLTISLWLLVALAIVVVVAFNLRQAWPRWRRRRAAAAAAAGSGESLAGSAATGAAGSGAAGGEAGRGRRNEPRLVSDEPGVPGDADLDDLPELDDAGPWNAAGSAAASVEAGGVPGDAYASAAGQAGGRTSQAQAATTHEGAVPPAAGSLASDDELPPWETSPAAQGRREPALPSTASPAAQAPQAGAGAAAGVRSAPGRAGAPATSAAGTSPAGAAPTGAVPAGIASSGAAAGGAASTAGASAGTASSGSSSSGASLSASSSNRSAAAGIASSGSTPADRAATAAPAVAGTARTPAPLLSELCDCIVVLKLPTPWVAERLLPVTQRFRRAGGKPVAAEARPVGASADDWQPIAPGHQYEAVRIGILLANRAGPLNALEYSDFIAGVQSLAEQFGSSADVPDMSGVLARARDLDSTSAQFDGLVGLNVECVEALSPDQLAALAAPLAIVERGNNRYARLGPHGEVVFSVALGDVPNRIAFLLDVPRAAPALEPWGQTVGCAMQCAQRLGGRLIDDNGRALTEADLTRVDRQVKQRYESLEAIGLPAGSSLALKVFN